MYVRGSVESEPTDWVRMRGEYADDPVCRRHEDPHPSSQLRTLQQGRLQRRTRDGRLGRPVHVDALAKNRLRHVRAKSC